MLALASRVSPHIELYRVGPRDEATSVATLALPAGEEGGNSRLRVRGIVLANKTGAAAGLELLLYLSELPKTASFFHGVDTGAGKPCALQIVTVDIEAGIVKAAAAAAAELASSTAPSGANGSVRQTRVMASKEDSTAFLSAAISSTTSRSGVAPAALRSTPPDGVDLAALDGLVQVGSSLAAAFRSEAGSSRSVLAVSGLLEEEHERHEDSAQMARIGSLIDDAVQLKKVNPKKTPGAFSTIADSVKPASVDRATTKRDYAAKMEALQQSIGRTAASSSSGVRSGSSSSTSSSSTTAGGGGGDGSIRDLKLWLADRLDGLEARMERLLGMTTQGLQALDKRVERLENTKGVSGGPCSSPRTVFVRPTTAHGATDVHSGDATGQTGSSVDISSAGEQNSWVFNGNECEFHITVGHAGAAI